MLLAVSISSILVIAYIGYTSGKTALTRSIFNQLTGLRAAKGHEIQFFFTNVSAQVQTLTQDPTVIEAVKTFKKTYGELDQQTIPPLWETAINQYYREQFIPKLAANVKGTPVAKTYQPTSNRDRYLQYHYTIKTSDFDQKGTDRGPQ